MNALQSFRKRIPMGPLTFPERTVNFLSCLHCSIKSHCPYYLLSMKSLQDAELANTESLLLSKRKGVFLQFLSLWQAAKHNLFYVCLCFKSSSISCDSLTLGCDPHHFMRCINGVSLPHILTLGGLVWPFVFSCVRIPGGTLQWSLMTILKIYFFLYFMCMCR